MAGPLPPPTLSGRTTKKKPGFFAASLNNSDERLLPVVTSKLLVGLTNNVVDNVIRALHKYLEIRVLIRFRSLFLYA